MAILLNPGNNEVGLCLGEELNNSTGRKLREVDDEEVANKCNNAGEDTFEDEDPSPPSDAWQDARGCSRIQFRGSVMLAPPGRPRSVILEL